MCDIIKYLITAILIINCFDTSAQVVFDSNFENARLDTSYIDSSEYRLWPITNLHFRITNAINQQPAFKIFDSLGYQLRSYHYMVYRYEGDSTWNFFDTAYKAGSASDYHFVNHQSFTSDTVYISYWFPYTYSDLQNYLAGIQSSPFLQNFGTKTHSYQGRSIYGYEITDPTIDDCLKNTIVITARQHPTEFINGYFVEGLSNYLLNSTDSVADLLRKHYRFFIYPMLNPDGVVNGIGTNVLGQDLNRSWEDSLIISNIPESDSIRPMIWSETNQHIDWSIDIHANPGNNQPYYWWGYTNASPVPVWQQAEALKFVQAVSGADSSGPMSQSLYQNYIQGNGVGSALTAANWFRQWFDAIAFTFEPTSEPMGPNGDNRISVNMLIQAGASLVKGFVSVVDSIQPLSGNIISGTNYLSAQIAGGTPPYTYNWSGPVMGNSDTLLNLLDGFYVLQVYDSRGCVWTDSLHFVSTTVSNFQLVNNEIAVYPNPASQSVYIEFNYAFKEVELNIYDLMGTRLSNYNFFNTELIEMDVSGFDFGIYFLKITADQSATIKKLIIGY